MVADLDSQVGRRAGHTRAGHPLRTEAATRMSTTRTDDQLGAVREELLVIAAQVRSGDFHSTPSQKVCGWCDYRAICPSRAE
jgi:PD-(D/E)XK nuclease superfamily